MTRALFGLPFAGRAFRACAIRRMAPVLGSLVLSIHAEAQTPAAGEADIVDVLVTYQRTNPVFPWQRSAPHARKGYAVRCGPQSYLTTEKLVRNHTLVELRRPREGEKLTAAVDISDVQRGLALLSVSADSPELPPDVPPLADRVPDDAVLRVVQFDPTHELQDFEARILQVRMDPLPGAPYASLLFDVLTDVNVNAEGAPVFHEGTLAGIVVAYDRSTRSAKVLPYTAIRRFLEDSAAPPYHGCASAGFMWKALIDPAKRAYLGLADDSRGVLVLSSLPESGAERVLKGNDVILEWEAYTVDNLGFYQDPDFGRLNFAHLIKARYAPGDTATVTILRDGRQQTVHLQLEHRTDSQALIPENVEGNQAEYLVSGGLVIRELTGAYLRAAGSNWPETVDPRLVFMYITRRFLPEQQGDRIVLLSQVLPDPVNIGYQHFHNQIIESINGQPVRNMADVFRVTRDRGIVEKVGLRSMGVPVVLDRDKVPESNARLARTYRIPALRNEASATPPPSGKLPPAAGPGPAQPRQHGGPLAP